MFSDIKSVRGYDPDFALTASKRRPFSTAARRIFTTSKAGES
jgi:hypothetical protein